MRHLISLTFILFFITAPLAGQEKQSDAAQNDQPIRFRLDNDGFFCGVARVDTDGTVVLKTAKRGIRGAPAQIAPTEGFYLGCHDRTWNHDSIPNLGRIRLMLR